MQEHTQQYEGACDDRDSPAVITQHAACMASHNSVSLGWVVPLLPCLLPSSSCSASKEQTPPTEGTPVDQGQTQLGTLCQVKMAACDWYPSSSCARSLEWTCTLSHTGLPLPLPCHEDDTTYRLLGRLASHLLGFDVPHLLVILLLKLLLALLVHLLEAV